MSDIFDSTRLSSVSIRSTDDSKSLSRVTLNASATDATGLSCCTSGSTPQDDNQDSLAGGWILSSNTSLTEIDARRATAHAKDTKQSPPRPHHGAASQPARRVTAVTIPSVMFVSRGARATQVATTTTTTADGADVTEVVAQPPKHLLIAPPHFSEYPEVLWQLWRRYMPGKAQPCSGECARVVRRARSADGKLVRWLATLKATSPSSNAARVSRVEEARVAEWMSFVTARVPPCREDGRQINALSTPHTRAQRQTRGVHRRLGDPMATPPPSTTTDSPDTGVASTAMPWNYLYESARLSSSAVAFLQTYYPAEMASCLSFAYHLREVVEYMRCHPPPPESPSETFMCPCGCSVSDIPFDLVFLARHAHYYKHRHAYTQVAVPPRASAVLAAEATSASNTPGTALCMLPFIALELFARVILSITEECAKRQEEAKPRAHRRSVSHDGSGKDCRIAGDDDDADTESLSVTQDPTGQAVCRAQALRTLRQHGGERMVIAACVIVAWKQVDVDADTTLFFWPTRSRMWYRRERSASGYVPWLARRHGDSLAAVRPKFTSDTFTEFRLCPDLDADQLLPVERFVLDTVGNTYAFGHVANWVSIAMEVTGQCHGDKMLAKANDSTETETPSDSPVAKSPEDEEADKDAEDDDDDGEDSAVAVAVNEEAVLLPLTFEAVPADTPFRTRVERVMCTCLRWLLVPIAASAVPLTETVVARYQLVTQRHPLLGVALAVHAGAVTPEEARKVVRPSRARLVAYAAAADCHISGDAGGDGAGTRSQRATPVPQRRRSAVRSTAAVMQQRARDLTVRTLRQLDVLLHGTNDFLRCAEKES